MSQVPYFPAISNFNILLNMKEMYNSEGRGNADATN